MKNLDRVDPALLRQLDDAKGTDPVRAAVSIRRARGVAPDPDTITRAAHAAVTRAGKTSQAELTSMRVLPHLGVAYVAGPGRLIRELLNQPEVVGAVAGAEPDEPAPDAPRAQDTPTVEG